MTWRSLARASSLVRYRASDERLDEILDLLAIHDHGALKRKRAAHVPGKLTWARLASLAVEALTPALLRGEEAAVERTLLLRARLEQRDAERHARVTTETRDAIVKLAGLATSMRAATELAEGETPTEGRVYALLSLHQRWWGVCRGEARRFDPATILALVRRACGAVLQDATAHASLKGIATRALQRWTPMDVGSSRLGDGDGEAVAWDDDL